MIKTEFDKCKNNCTYFLEQYCVINDKPIILKDYQKSLIKFLKEHESNKTN